MELNSFTVYQDELAQLRQNNLTALDNLRSYRKVIEWADRLANLWSLNRNWYGTVDSRGRKVNLVIYVTHWSCNCTLNLWLGKNDSMALESLGRIFDKAVFDNLFEDDIKCTDVKDGSSRTWEFMVRKNSTLDTGIGNKIKFYITCHVKDSNHCRTVGTGKFVEEMRIECGEV